METVDKLRCSYESRLNSFRLFDGEQTNDPSKFSSQQAEQWHLKTTLFTTITTSGSQSGSHPTASGSHLTTSGTTSGSHRNLTASGLNVPSHSCGVLLNSSNDPFHHSNGPPKLPFSRESRSRRNSNASLKTLVISDSSTSDEEDDEIPLAVHLRAIRTEKRISGVRVPSPSNSIDTTTLMKNSNDACISTNASPVMNSKDNENGSKKRKKSFISRLMNLFTIRDKDINVSFTNTVPRDHASFTNTVPRDNVSFTNTVPRDHASFTNTVPRDHASFTNTVPRDHASFSNTATQFDEQLDEMKNEAIELTSFSDLIQEYFLQELLLHLNTDSNNAHSNAHSNNTTYNDDNARSNAHSNDTTNTDSNNTTNTDDNDDRNDTNSAQSIDSLSIHDKKQFDNHNLSLLELVNRSNRLYESLTVV